MKPKPGFLVVGLTVAFLEEFITQGVLKKNPAGWIIPTIIAFLPFLIVVRLISKRLDKRMVESHAVLAYYAIAGSIGLAVEWLLIGLSPWTNTSANPVLMLVFQFGIFSFWGSVAFAPKLLMDRRASVAQLRKWYRRCLPLGFASIYFVTFTASQQAPFILGVGSVLATFILLNPFYFQYFRILGRSVGAGGMSPGSRDSTAMNSSNMYQAPRSSRDSTVSPFSTVAIVVPSFSSQCSGSP